MRLHLGALLAVLALLLLVAPSSMADDTTPPVVTAPADMTVSAPDSSGTIVTYPDATAVDDVDGPIPATCAPASGTNFLPGATLVTCSATDVAGHTGTATFTVTVTVSAAADTTAPTVNVPANQSATTPGATAVVNYPAPTAHDDVDGDLTPACNPSGNVFALGVTLVTCTATDSAGNTGTATFKVTVTFDDVIAPVLHLPADQSAAAVDASGAVVHYPAPTATDNHDPSPQISCTHSSGDTFPIGQTTVTCTATDASNNSSTDRFFVSVNDTDPPVVHVPANQTVRAQGRNTTVTFTVTATDNVDPSPSITCDRPFTSQYTVGQTTVTCTANDGHLTSTPASFRVIVNDSAPSINGIPANIVAEADGPAGAVVTYTLPSATDTVDGGLPINCSPDPNSTFHLGATTVNCSATNSSNQTATSSFAVTVRDTTPPTLGVPGSIRLTAAGDVPASDPNVVAFLALKAHDLVDQNVTVTNDAPNVFHAGTTTVKFTAVDNDGNKSTATGQVEVVRPPAGQPAPATPVATQPLDRTAPGNVVGLSVNVSGRSALLRWHLPQDNDFDHLQISRARGDTSPVVIYRGSATQFTDHRLIPGIHYRYLIVTLDKTGNQSTGVAALATAHAVMLFGPSEGAHVSTPVILRWRPSAGTTFYNVQLYRRGKKIFSSFPTTAKLVLPATWRYGGRAFRLAPGRYDWYVWPATGSRSKPRFKPLEGFSSFTVTSS